MDLLLILMSYIMTSPSKSDIAWVSVASTVSLKSSNNFVLLMHQSHHWYDLDRESHVYVVVPFSVQIRVSTWRSLGSALSISTFRDGTGCIATLAKP